MKNQEWYYRAVKGWRNNGKSATSRKKKDNGGIRVKILVACEESQAVTVQLRERGHEAYSCDILECSGDHKEWHIRGDVLPLINGNCEFITMDGEKHSIEGKWDMLIAFQPCTHLAVSGARHFEKKRADGRQRDGIEFFCKMLQADCDRIAVENPVNIISGDYIKKWFPDLAEEYNLPIKPTQSIQPYEYGSPIRKKTCLWLKGIKKLEPTNIVKPDIINAEYKNKTTSFSGAAWYVRDENGKILSWKDPRTAKQRSKTYIGVAKAMAEQWAGKIL